MNEKVYCSYRWTEYNYFSATPDNLLFNLILFVFFIFAEVIELAYFHIFVSGNPKFLKDINFIKVILKFNLSS